MCKLAIIPYVKPGKEEAAMRFAATMAPILTRNDSDGFGYMALGEAGLFGERWLNTGDAFKLRDDGAEYALAIESAYMGALEPTSGAGYNSFGQKTARFSCIAMHARMATCGVTMANVHPFIARDGLTGLIHNGVISNAASFPSTLSTCDSEAILTSYIDSNVVNVSDNIQRVSESLIGWWACATIAKADNGAWYLDIFKDDRTPLVAMFIAELDGIVFCTKEAMVREACRTLGWSVGACFDVQENVLIRHLAETGEVVEIVDIEPTSVVVPARFDAGAETTLVDDDGPLDSYDYITNQSYWSHRRRRQ